MAAKNKYAAELVELRKQANEFLKENYSLELKVPIVINNRLKSTIGCVTFIQAQPEKIELAGILMQYGSKEFILDVLKHELVHYALFILEKPYHDGQVYFEDELRRLGITSTGIGRLGKFLKFKCPECKEIGYTEVKGAMKNPSRYSTNCCDKTLIPISHVICDGETETEFQEEPDEK